MDAIVAMVGTYAAIWLGWTTSLFALGILLIAGMLFEHADWRGTAVVLWLLAVCGAFLRFDWSIQQLVWYIAGYVILGAFYSIWRYRRYVQVMLRNATSTRDFEAAAERAHPSNNKGKMTAWVIIWPISAAEYAIRDIIDLVELLVSTYLREAYQRIYDSIVSEARIQLNQRIQESDKAKGSH